MKNKLLLMIKICLIISGVVFICLSIFTEQKNNTYLILSLASTTIGNIMNIIDIRKDKLHKWFHTRILHRMGFIWNFKTKKQLLEFLKKAPIIDNFNENQKELDEDLLEQYIGKNTSNKGIRLVRRYYGITGRK